MNGENVSVKEVPGFTTFEEAKPYLIACGKAAREIATQVEGFFTNHAMKEVENAWYKALHADCGYTVYSAACDAFGWLAKMENFRRTGAMEF